jgi:hypothetical protein
VTANSPIPSNPTRQSSDILFKNTHHIICHFLPQAGSMGPDMFCNFYLVESHNINNNSATTEASGKIGADF